MSKLLLVLSVVLSACTSVVVHEAKYQFPFGATTHEELLKMIPPAAFAGDVAGMSKLEYLDFIFAKNSPNDQVPMQVALYRKHGEALQLEYVADTPFKPGDCAGRRCTARLTPILNGFQISLITNDSGHLRSDYSFIWTGSDLKLVSRAVAQQKPKSCSIYDDLLHGKRVTQVNGQSKMAALPGGDTRPLFLRKDKIKFQRPSTCL